MSIYDIVAIARPFVDVIASVDEQFLRRRRIEDGSVVEVTPRELLAIRAELPRYEIQAGGSLSNTVVGMAALGARAAFLGKACDDKAGQLFRNAFRQHGVLFPNSDLRAGPEDITGTCLVLVTPDGQGTVVCSRGVADRLTSQDMFPDIVSAARMVYIEGNFLCFEESRCIFEAIETARKAQIPLVLSLHGMCEADKGRFREAYVPGYEIVIGNRREFKAAFDVVDLSGFINQPTCMVMTAGPDGVIIAGRGEHFHIPPHRLGAKPNTVGAGDQFAAGFLMGYLHGLSIERCAEFGGETADAVLEKAGARHPGDWKELAAKYIAGREPITLRGFEVTGK